MFACFTLAFVIARRTRGDRAADCAWPVLAGVAAGLAVATKETAVIVLPGVAGRVRARVVVARVGTAVAAIARPTPRWREPRSSACAIGAAIAALFYSSFLDASGAASCEPLRGARTYVAARHGSRRATRTRGTTTSACSPGRRPAA